MNLIESDYTEDIAGTLTAKMINQNNQQINLCGE